VVRQWGESGCEREGVRAKGGKEKFIFYHKFFANIYLIGNLGREFPMFGPLLLG
jgi:hypothetical protein